MSILPRRGKTQTRPRDSADDLAIHRSYSVNRGLVFINNQIRTVQRGLEVNCSSTSLGDLTDGTDHIQSRQYEARCQLKIDRIERNIHILEGFEIVTNLASAVVGAVELLGPAGPVIYSINQLLGYAKSVQVNKREALSVTDKAVAMTLGMQRTIKHVNYQIPQVMIVCIHDFYRALDECATDVCTAAENSTLPKELLAQVHGESFKAILEDGKEAMEEAYKMFIANCQVIAIAGIYHPNNPNVIAEDQQDRKADEEFMCQDLRRLLALGVDPFLDALQIAGLTPSQRHGIKRAIVIAWKLEEAKKQQVGSATAWGSGSNSGIGVPSTPPTAAAMNTSNTTSSLNTLVNPVTFPKPISFTTGNTSRPASPQPPVTIFMLLYMVDTPSVAEALARPLTPIPDIGQPASISEINPAEELISLRSDFFKRAFDVLYAMEAPSSLPPPLPPRRSQMKLTSVEPKPFLSHIDSSTVPEWAVFDEEILFIRRVGDSPLGNTWKGHWNGKNVRVKSISRPPEAITGSTKRLGLWRNTYLEQVKMWRNLTANPYVLEFLGASYVLKPSAWHFISPYMANGDINAYLASPRGGSADRLALVYQIAQGLKHLHAQKIVHGNLNSKNVLINDKGDAVLSDFGFFFDMTAQLEYDFQGRPETALLSPEVLQVLKSPRAHGARDDEVTMSSDVFAFGKTALYVLSGIMPATFTPELPFDLDKRCILHEILIRAYRNNPSKRPTMARLCNILEKHKFTSGVLVNEIDVISLRLGMTGLDLWIDAMKATGAQMPYTQDCLDVPLLSAQRPVTDEAEVSNAEDNLDPSWHWKLIDVPRKLQAVIFSLRLNQEDLFPLIQATLGLYKRLLSVGWTISFEDPEVRPVLTATVIRIFDNLQILQTISTGSRITEVIDCDLIREIMFGARVLTLRASMRLPKPGDIGPCAWTAERSLEFRQEVGLLLEEHLENGASVCRQLERLIDDETLLWSNGIVARTSEASPHLELAGDSLYGRPGYKAALKPLLDRIAGFPWWSGEQMHELAEYDSEVDPAHVLTTETTRLEHTSEVVEIENAIQEAMKGDTGEKHRAIEAAIREKVYPLIDVIREIEGLPMSTHVDDRYADTEKPPAQIIASSASKMTPKSLKPIVTDSGKLGVDQAGKGGSPQAKNPSPKLKVAKGGGKRSPVRDNKGRSLLKFRTKNLDMAPA
ncbi:hypothetical protein IAU59_002561 [Kwoniella sp. CBS 9459]